MRLSRACRLITAIVAAGVVLLATLAVRAADVGRAKHTVSSKRRATYSAPAARKGVTQSRRTQKRTSAKGRAASRRVNSRQRLARLRLEPSRVKEIQQALIQTGYLNHEATGSWDDVTRDAMRRYQADNRFPTTGLPEAKSLLKLGLGPHPLPPELDTENRGQGPPSESTTPGVDSSDTEATAHRAAALATASHSK